MPLERCGNAIDALWSAVSHLHGVADTPNSAPPMPRGWGGWSSPAPGCTRIATCTTAVALTASPAFADLSRPDRVAVERAIRDFTLSGVALDAEARARFAEISVELSQLGTEFGSAVLDATDAWSEHVTRRGAAGGVSEADLGMFAAAAQAKGLDGWLVTLHQPSVSAILTFAEDRDLRAGVYRAFGTRASDQGPDAGRFDNGPRIARLLTLRHELAHLLGFTDPVALSLATKMAPDAGEVLTFLRDLAKRARPIAERELAELRDYAAAELGIADLQPWTSASPASGCAPRAMRSTNRRCARTSGRAGVLEGWQALLGRLFGIRLAGARMSICGIPMPVITMSPTRMAASSPACISTSMPAPASAAARGWRRRGPACATATRSACRSPIWSATSRRRGRGRRRCSAMATC